MTDRPPSQKETVVLLHGILKNKFDMAKLSKGLKTEGYQVINISYPSRTMDLDKLSDFVHDTLKLSEDFNDAAKVHFVTHSMGGLVTRYLLHKHRPDNLGRVVMLSPPNQGSEFANWMTETESIRKLYEDVFGKDAAEKGAKTLERLTEKNPLKRVFDVVYGPAGAQLRTDHEHNVAPAVDFPLGVIAGNSSINPLAPWVLGRGNDHDGVVPIERMKIDGMKDMIVLPTSHMMMVFNNEVRRQVVHFLRHERFDHAPPKPC
ncbi:MAG: alpha/beta fold hydrolase [Rhodospirillales bacterium]|nr:alpha/beta fold hydrolase [Rhodospirillales bacterium]MCB9995311.1 alpha/beta fold hydrolase [Rhodospirillales bacterium]